MWILLLEALVALALLFAIVWASKPRRQPPAQRPATDTPPPQEKPDDEPR